jgi:hypothetical protein
MADASSNFKNTSNSVDDKPTKIIITEVLPKSGLVYSEKGPLTETLCKPKMLPVTTNAVKKYQNKLSGKPLESKAEDQ